MCFIMHDVYKKLKKLVPRTVVSKELKELLAGTEEGKMCTVKYTVCQTWLCVCMCSCFYVIGVGYKLMCELSEHLFERECFPSTFRMYKHATNQ